MLSLIMLDDVDDDDNVYNRLHRAPCVDMIYLAYSDCDRRFPSRVATISRAQSSVERMSVNAMASGRPRPRAYLFSTSGFASSGAQFFGIATGEH